MGEHHICRRASPLAIIVAALSCALGCAVDLPIVDEPCDTWLEPGLYGLPLAEFDRTPWIYVPGNAGPRKAVVMLHGAGSTSDIVKDQVTRFLTDAEAQGFVAVFPNGSGTPAGYYWNAGRCCGVAPGLNAPDVAYLDAVAKAVRSRTCVDEVVASGQSNGAMMALRWACEGQGVDGLVTSSGADVFEGDCKGDPIPVAMAHGTDDKLVPFEGGQNADGVQFSPAPQSIDRFLVRNDCDVSPTIEVEGNTRCEVYDCDTPTRFCAVDGGKHQWFGASKARADGFDAESEVYGMFNRKER